MEVSDNVQPSISVIIPTYNYGHYIKRAVDSVLLQLRPHDELLVIDDGSNDGTEQILQEYLGLESCVFKFFKQSNSGAASARNHGIDRANGTYLIFLDADDELLPSALDNIRTHLAAHSGSQVIIGGYVSVWPNGKKRVRLPHPLADNSLLRLNDYLLRKKISILHGASVFHRDVYLKGKYPEEFKNSEDIPVFAQALANYRCSILEKPLAKIYKHQDSLRHQNRYVMNGGLSLVDEIFSTARLGREFQKLKRPYLIKRNIKLFKTYADVGNGPMAIYHLRQAIKANWLLVLTHPTLLLKALFILFTGKNK